MLEKIRKFVKEQQMLLPGDHIVVGVSGGADSVCLLLVLQKLQAEIAFTMEVVHVEHGIRGKESLEDADFVETLCEKLQVPVQIFSVDVPKLAKQQKCSVEEMGRKVRYDLLQKRCALHTQGKIAVAHHKNDQAETVLFHLVRGSNLRGMEGMHPVEGNCIRPLLCVDRKEIEDYLEKRGQAYRNDQTNQENAYHRNKIRNQVLPQLEQVNPKAVEHICDLAQCVKEASEYLCKQAVMLESEMVEYTSDIAEISAEHFLQVSEVLQKQILYNVLAYLAGTEKDLTSAHIEAVLGLFLKKAGKQISLPYHLLAKRTYTHVRIEKQSEKQVEKTEKMPIQQIELPIPGEIWLPNKIGKIKTSVRKNSEKIHQIPRNWYTKWFDYDKMNSNVQIRTRRAGDYLVIDSEGRKQSLKKYFINAKIPVEKRENVFVVAQGSEILWVIGYRTSAAYWVTKETKQILEICCEIEKKPE
ncbi:MAG: tRNA lysidine(34) synthetase TilS [Lachnospiraceae bacterium]